MVWALTPNACGTVGAFVERCVAVFAFASMQSPRTPLRTHWTEGVVLSMIDRVFLCDLNSVVVEFDLDAQVTLDGLSVPAGNQRTRG